MPDLQRKLFMCCPSCGAARDFDTDASRHYGCGTRGDYSTGAYTYRCGGQSSCANCTALAALVKTQGEEIDRLQALLEAR